MLDKIDISESQYCDNGGSYVLLLKYKNSITETDKNVIINKMNNIPESIIKEDSNKKYITAHSDNPIKLYNFMISNGFKLKLTTINNIEI